MDQNTEPVIIRSGAAFNRSASRQDYSTPREFLDAVEARFGPIELDLAATAANAVCSDFISPEENSLTVPWGGTYSCQAWLNPPFGNIGHWARKCYMETMDSHLKILFLVPASVGSNWYRQYVHNKALVFFLNGRLSFDGVNPYPKDCMLAAYNFGIPGVETLKGCKVWKWK